MAIEKILKFKKLDKDSIEAVDPIIMSKLKHIYSQNVVIINDPYVEKTALALYEAKCELVDQNEKEFIFRYEIYNENPLTFVIDTGSTNSLIKVSSAKSLRSENSINSVSGVTYGYGVGGGRIRHYGKVSSLFSPNLKLNKFITQEFTITDLDDTYDAHQKNFGTKIDGCLGIDFLMYYNCIMDFRCGRIQIGGERFCYGEQ